MHGLFVYSETITSVFFSRFNWC